jgi:hypothetical protein
MIYLRHTPRPPLSEFIELLWLFENVASHASERVLPTGAIELVINLREETCRSFDGVVAGPHSRFFMLDTSGPTSVIGVHFRPGGAFPFFTLPMDQLRNQHVSLQALWGKRADELRERLLAAETGQAKLLLLENALLYLLRRPESRHAAIGHALARFLRGPQRITDVVDETGMPLHPTVLRGGGSHAQIVLPHSPLSARRGALASCASRRLGRYRARLRLLRPVAHDSRLSGLRRPQPNRLSFAPHRAHESCPAVIWWLPFPGRR